MGSLFSGFWQPPQPINANIPHDSSSLSGNSRWIHPKNLLQWPRGFVARSPNFGNDARRCSLDHASGDGGGVPGRKKGVG